MHLPAAGPQAPQSTSLPTPGRGSGPADQLTAPAPPSPPPYPSSGAFISADYTGWIAFSSPSHRICSLPVRALHLAILF